MNFEDFDKLCVKASDVKPDGVLSVVSPEPMHIQFFWTWRIAEDKDRWGIGVDLSLNQLEIEGEAYSATMFNSVRLVIERGLKQYKEGE